ncbi:MAG: hypothetical protein IPL40_16340 [Proteobacteria bacterium]|nr:hypothetical protein [Pseudomonadota bacterium]
MSDERRRKSWREIDQQRGQSPQRREERPAGGAPRGARSQQSYRSALDRLFESGRIGQLVDAQAGAASPPDPELVQRQALLRALVMAEGRDAVTQAAEAYLAHGAWPEDVEALARVIEHRDPARQAEAIERMLAQLEGQRPRRARAVLGQLRLIRDTADDERLVSLAEQLLARLD